MAITRSSYRLCIPSLLFALLSLLLLIGCESKGVFIEGTLAVGTPALTTTAGDDADSYSHVFIPDQANHLTTNGVSFTIGLNKVVLRSSTDTSLSFIVFDTGVDTPFTITLFYEANTNLLFGNSPNNPNNGTYDQVEYQVTFYAMTVPAVSGSHLARLNLASYTLNDQQACQKDILLDLVFLKPNDGQPLTASRNCGTPTQAYQIPDAQVTAGGSPIGDPYLFTLTLPSPGITISDSTDEKTTITLEFGIDKIFFFDDTDGNLFEPFSNCQTFLSCDGRLASANTVTQKGSAHFWIGFPKVTAAVE